MRLTLLNDGTIDRARGAIIDVINDAIAGYAKLAHKLFGIKPSVAFTDSADDPAHLSVDLGDNASMVLTVTSDRNVSIEGSDHYVKLVRAPKLRRLAGVDAAIEALVADAMMVKRQRGA